MLSKIALAGYKVRCITPPNQLLVINMFDKTAERDEMTDIIRRKIRTFLATSVAM